MNQIDLSATNDPNGSKAPKRHQATVEQAYALARVVALSPRPMTRAEIVAGMGGSDAHFATVLRWLEVAQKLGLVAREGLSRATVYVAAPGFRASMVAQEMAKPVTRRPKVGYSREFLEAYRPNKMSYLGDARLGALALKCKPGSSPMRAMDERKLASFMADLAYSSSKLEGNTYSYKATLLLVEEGVAASGHDAEEAAMLINHYDAARFLIKHINYPPRQGDPAVSAFDIRSLHAMLSHDLLPDPRRCGQLRVGAVEIGESSYIPLSMVSEIEACFNYVLSTASAIENPFEQAFFLLVHLPYLQPFDDCNKRTARVGCNIPLLRAGALPMSWHDTSTKEFVDGVLSVYEHNDTYALAEVFSEGYARSAERFAVVHRSIRPAMVSSTYRRQIRDAIVEVVGGEALTVPESVRPEDASEFLGYVNERLAALRENETLGPAYGIDREQLSLWVGRSRTRREVEAG